MAEVFVVEHRIDKDNAAFWDTVVIGIFSTLELALADCHAELDCLHNEPSWFYVYNEVVDGGTTEKRIRRVIDRQGSVSHGHQKFVWSDGLYILDPGVVSS